MIKQDELFNNPKYWIWGAAFKVLSKRFDFSQIDLGEYNKLFNQFLKML